MKYLLITLIAITALIAAERKDTLIIVKCDTTTIVRTLKDSTITTVVKKDTLKIVKPEKKKGKK